MLSLILETVVLQMIIRLSSVPRLFLGLVTSSFLCAATSEARETYSAFAQRLTNIQDQNVKFRPDLEKVVLQAVNQYRLSKGKKALIRSDENSVAARAHAMDMALHDFVGHRSSTGQNFDSRMRALKDGALFLPAMGENAARVSSDEPADQAKAMKLVSQWIKSPSHRRAMVSVSFNYASVGIVQKGTKLYAVQIFSGPEVSTNLNVNKKTPAASATKGLY
jgi:uncharacterized protein YkwD